MAKMEKDIYLKTSLLGFDKKSTIDYIEKLQLENEGLKRQVQDLSAQQNTLLKENAMFRARVDLLSREKAAAPAQSFQEVTYEDLSAAPDYVMPYETVGRRTTAPSSGAHVVSSKKNVTKKGGKTYISSKK